MIKLLAITQIWDPDWMRALRPDPCTLGAENVAREDWEATFRAVVKNCPRNVCWSIRLTVDRRKTATSLTPSTSWAAVNVSRLSMTADTIRCF